MSRPTSSQLPPRPSYRRALIFLAVVIVVVTVAGVRMLQLQLDKRSALLAQEKLAGLKTAYEEQRIIGRSVLSAAREYVRVDEVVTPDDWRRFVSGQQLATVLPGFISVLFAERGDTGYIVRYAAPKGTIPIGENLSTDSRFLGAISLSRDTGEPSTALFQNADGTHSFMLFLPLYESAYIPNDIDSRRSLVRGMVALERSAEQAMVGLATSLDTSLGALGLRMTLDGVAIANDSYGRLAVSPGVSTITDALPFGQSTLGVELVYSSDYGSSDYSEVAVLLTGLIGALLVFRIVRLIMVYGRDERRTREAIEAATATLRSREAELRTALTDAQKFRQAVSQSAEQIVITDLDGNILFANDALREVTGFAPHEVIGKKAGSRELWGGQMPKEFYQRMWHTIKDEELPFYGEFHNKRKSGEAYESSTVISPIVGDSGKVEYFVASEQDVSTKKDMENIQNEFVSIASHQLRTPLGGIRWVAERLLRTEKLSADGYSYLRDILSSAKNLANLVDLLLNVSRLEQEGGPGVQSEKIELVGFMRQFMAEMAPIADRKHIQMSIVASSPEIPMETDRVAIRNIVQTYISNALEYTPDGGRVEIMVDTSPGVVRISVHDTGIGIPVEAQKGVFQKFFRGENARRAKPGGTGLGLYLARRSAELLGGVVWFDSKTGKGTSFYAEIPLITKSRTGGKPLA